MSAGLVSMPVARATFRERAGSGLAVAMAALAALAAASSGAQMVWAGQIFSGFSRFFLIGVTMALGAGLIADEFDSGHAQLVLLRPITRAEWFGGRLSGAAAALLAACVLAWLAGLAGAVSKGGRPDPAWLAALPAIYVEALGWLAVLAALSVVLRRAMNVGAVLALALVFLFVQVTLPFVLGKPELARTIHDQVAPYLGPMSAEAIPVALRKGDRVKMAAAFYDLLWVFTCWLGGVLLLNRRELSRRRE